MKVEQDADFKPIVITLETREEALIFWDIMLGNKDANTKDFMTRMSNWFSEEAHL